MKYLSASDARELPGLRLALTAGVPAPWSESAKALFRLRNIDYLPVEQLGGQGNEELLSWTGHRNAPVAIYQQEAPRVRWIEMIELAERLGQGPRLLPDTLNERITTIGLCNEIAGETGFGWYARVLMLKQMINDRGEEATRSPIFRDYSRGIDNIEQSIDRIREVLECLQMQLQAQKALESPYLVGSGLSAADVFWAYFSLLLKPLPSDLCDAPDYILQFWSAVPAAIGLMPDELLTHRNFMFEKHLLTPMSF
ncbi:MAG: hypothetical protein AAF513_10030 [Pseudomonadota bacterium]